MPDEKKALQPASGGKWRVGGKVPLNVYEGDVPMFQCHTPEQAARIVALLNQPQALQPASGGKWRVNRGFDITDGSSTIEVMECTSKAMGYRAGLARHLCSLLNQPKVTLTREQVWSRLMDRTAFEDCNEAEFRELDEYCAMLREMGVDVEGD